MYPTRTTTTTGTLRVPAAPAPTPTTFGWASTTPTLSLRLPPPPDPTTPAPAGGTPPGAVAPRPATPAPAAAGGVPSRSGVPSAPPAPAGPTPAGGDPSAAPTGGALPGANAPQCAPVDAAARSGRALPGAVGPEPAPAAAPAARASTDRDPSPTGAPQAAPAPVLRAVPAPAGEVAPLTADRRGAPQAPDGAGAELDVPAWCGPAARAASVSADRVPSRAGAPARLPDATPPPAASAGSCTAFPAEEAGDAAEGSGAVPGVAPAPATEPGGGEAPADAAAVQAPRPGPLDTYAAPAAPARVEDAPAVVPAPAGEAPAPGRAAQREQRPAGDGSGAPAAPAPHGAEPTVPAAREQSASESDAGTGGPRNANSGVPGPGAAEIVALAVARGMGAAEEDGTRGLPAAAAPHRGSAVTEVPVHFPFHPDAPAPTPAPAAAPTRPRRAAAPGRRVPRGDDRLREHRGPVLPGWVGVTVGGLALAGCTAVFWRAGVVPGPLLAAFGAAPRAYRGLHAAHWPPLAFLGIVALVALGGLGRARTGHAWVLTLFGRYRGTVRRTGLTWVSPLLLRRRVDVRLRHWRSDPMPAVDSGGLALQVVVQVVWQVKDTARATLAVADHTEYLAEQVESAMARVLSQLPADAFHEDAPSLRDAEAVGDALTRMLAAETEAVGIEVFSAQPTRIEYAPEVAEAMRRRRVAAIDARHRDAVLTSVVDAVDDTVHRLTSRGLVELDDYERKALVKDLTVAFCTGRTE